MRSFENINHRGTRSFDMNFIFFSVKLRVLCGEKILSIRI